MAPSHRKATQEHRRRTAARGLVRLEVQANRSDVPLIRAVAEVLRQDGAEAETARERLRDIVPAKPKRTLLDVFLAIAPPIETDDIAFERDKDATWRDIDL